MLPLRNSTLDGLTSRGTRRSGLAEPSARAAVTTAEPPHRADPWPTRMTAAAQRAVILLRRLPRNVVIVVAVLAVLAVIGVLVAVTRVGAPLGANALPGAAVPVGQRPRGLAVSPDGRQVYVANFNSDSVSVVDTGSGEVTAIPVGDGPVQAVVSPDGGRAYVANIGSDSLSVVDTGARAVIATIPVGDHPEGVGVSPAGSRVYVTNFNSGTLTVVDAVAGAMTATIPVGIQPTSVAVSPDGPGPTSPTSSPARCRWSTPAPAW